MALTAAQMARLDKIAQDAGYKPVKQSNGLSQEQMTRLDKIAQDAGYKLVSQAAVNTQNQSQSFGDMAKNAVMGAAQDINAAGDFTVNRAKDLVQGAAQGVSSLIPYLVPDAFKKQLNNAGLDKFSTQKGREQVFSKLGSGDKSASADIARSIGEYLPFSEAAPESLIAKGGQFAGKEISNLSPKIAQFLSKVTPSARTTADTLAGSVSQAAQADNNKGAAAIEGGAANLIPTAVLKGAEKLRPSKMFRGNISDDDLLKNLQATQGTSTDLGTVVQNPYLMRQYKNVLSKIPGSGVGKKLSETQSQVRQQAKDSMESILGSTDPQQLNESIENLGENALKVSLNDKDLSNQTDKINQTGKALIDKLSGGLNPNDANQVLKARLDDAYQKAEDEKYNLYKKRDDYINSIGGLNIDDSGFSGKAKNILSEANSTKYLKEEPEMAKLISKTSAYKPKKVKAGFDYGSGKQIYEDANRKKPLSISEATKIKSKLYNLGQSLRSSPMPLDRETGGKFLSLSKAMSDDINNSIKNTGDETLMKLHNDANENYKNSFSPFLNKDVYKFIKGRSDPDTLVSKFLKQTGDRPEMAKKLGDLSPELKESMSGAYFGKSFDRDGNVDHLSLAKQIKSAPKHLMDYLVPNKSDKDLLNAYANKSDLVKNISGFVNPDGSVDYSKMSKSVKQLISDPNEFRRLSPDKKGREALKAFYDSHEKYKTFEKTLNDDESVNLGALSRVQKSLAKNKKDYEKAIPSEADRKKLEAQIRLQKLNPTSDDPMFNPATGQKTLDALAPLALFEVGNYGGEKLGIPGSGLASALALSLASRGATKALTSESLRNNLVRAMIENKNRIATANKIKAAQIASQAAMNNERG